MRRITFRISFMRIWMMQRKPSFETACILNEQIEPATLHIRDKQ